MKVLISMVALCGFTALAAESMSEKANSKAKDAERSAKKMGHRAGEMVCMEGDMECLAKKAKHRGAEAKDYMKDKATETKDAVDADGKAGH